MMENRMIWSVLWLLVSLLFCLTVLPAGAEEMRDVQVEVNGSVYSLTLEDNETAAAFAAILPMTLKMTELNGNEKYHYLMSPLPSTGDYSGQIHAGDVMLFGNDCVVLFYRDFITSYRYTRIGSLVDAEGLAETLDTGDVSVSFVQPE